MHECTCMILFLGRDIIFLSSAQLLASPCVSIILKVVQWLPMERSAHKCCPLSLISLLVCPRRGCHNRRHPAAVYLPTGAVPLLSFGHGPRVLGSHRLLQGSQLRRVLRVKGGESVAPSDDPRKRTRTHREDFSEHYLVSLTSNMGVYLRRRVRRLGHTASQRRARRPTFSRLERRRVATLHRLVSYRHRRRQKGPAHGRGLSLVLFPHLHCLVSSFWGRWRRRSRGRGRKNLLQVGGVRRSLLLVHGCPPPDLPVREDLGKKNNRWGEQLTAEEGSEVREGDGKVVWAEELHRWQDRMQTRVWRPLDRRILQLLILPNRPILFKKK